LLGLAFILGATSARADAASARRGARLTWVRGVSTERCVGRLGLEEDVKARLGYDPFALGEAIAIEGAVTRQTTGYRAELVLRDERGDVLGTRTLASREQDCRALGEAVAVAITVAIDPDAAGTRPLRAPETPPVEERVPETASVPAQAPWVEPSREERGRASLAIGVSAGVVPDVAPFLSLRARRAMASGWEIGVGGHFWPESRSGGVGFALATGSLDSCLAPLASARWARWCAGLHVGVFQVFVHASELAPVDVGMFPWSAAETGPAVSIRAFGPVRLDAGLSGIVPLIRREALVRGLSGAVWEQSAVGGRADIGIAAVF
jgi:hypothetical protein